MPYELRRELIDGQLCRLSIGLDPVDDYLDFLRCRCRPNTWLNYAHDLKIFFNTVDKPLWPPPVSRTSSYRTVAP